jgi:hypothetical protein
MRNHNPIAECNDDALHGACEGPRAKRRSSNGATITNLYVAAIGSCAEVTELGAGRCSARDCYTAGKRLAGIFTGDARRDFNSHQ